MKAQLSNYHQAPRKVRLVADLIRGKSVPAARVALSFLPKKSGPAIAKLLDSAVANAGQMNFTADQLFVKTISVDKGIIMRRARPFSRGRSGTIRKTMSIIRLELSPLQAVSAKTVKKAAAAEKPAAKKVAAKKTEKKLTPKT
jgi:large subunit ribosomal protein L22